MFERAGDGGLQITREMAAPPRAVKLTMTGGIIESFADGTSRVQPTATRSGDEAAEFVSVATANAAQAWPPYSGRISHNRSGGRAVRPATRHGISHGRPNWLALLVEFQLAMNACAPGTSLRPPVTQEEEVVAAGTAKVQLPNHAVKQRSKPAYKTCHSHRRYRRGSARRSRRNDAAKYHEHDRGNQPAYASAVEATKPRPLMRIRSQAA
jgi:hypothetical protein